MGIVRDYEKFFRVPIFRTHRAVIFAIAQLSCQNSFRPSIVKLDLTDCELFLICTMIIFLLTYLHVLGHATVCRLFVRLSVHMSVHL